MTEQTSPAKTNPAVTLGWGEKFGYAAGDMASCLYFGIFMNFLAIFYTDVFGISPRSRDHAPVDPDLGLDQ
jgi:hypothetical protein